MSAARNEKKRVYEDIVNLIMQQIREGTLRPGSRLPSERQLAEDFHASRTAVREALHTLSSLGYIESRVGDGTFVKEVTLDDVLRPFSGVLSRDSKLIEDELDVRIILEQESARRSALHANGRDCRKLHSAIQEMQKEVDAGRSGLEKDELFHRHLAAASQNEAIRQILTMCDDLLATSTRYALSRPGRPQESVDDHREIYQAVERHDAGAAMEAMKRHLEKGYDLVSEGRAG